MKKKYTLTSSIGQYSGNRRINTTDLEEPDPDNEETLKKWFDGNKKVPYKSKLRMYKRIISETIDPKKLTVHIVGQSHLDCAWMWRFEQTRKKADVTFSKAVLHSEMFPKTFHFAISQPLQLQWIKEDNPKLFSKIKELIEKGNIELVGGSYVEPDCMMPSGEAMIRQRLYGMRFYMKNFDIIPQIEWFLDSFGYNHGLPQILSKSGAKYFWTTKLTWNLDTTFPLVNFWWQGPDGSKILTTNFPYDLTVLGSWNRFELGRHLLKDEAKRIWKYSTGYQDFKDFVKHEICPQIGCFFGLSDGGHGPTHKEVAVVNKFVEKEWIKWSTVEKFFKEVEKYAKEFPIWNDELYLEIHRGCFSNHAKVKRQNRKFENLIVAFEKIASFLSILDSNYIYPRKDLELLWKYTLKNQFHDVLPGSSIPEVYDDVWEDWIHQKQLISNISNQITKSLLKTEKVDSINNSNSNIKQIILFNSLSWKRKSPLFIPLKIFSDSEDFQNEGLPYMKLTLESNKKIFLCQPEYSVFESIGIKLIGWWCVPELTPLSIVNAKLEPLSEEETKDLIKKTEGSLNVTDLVISNEMTKIRINSNNGSISHLKVKGINNQNNLLKGQNSNLTFGFLDDDKSYPAWNLQPKYWEFPKNYSNEKDLSINISDDGPIFTTLEIKKTIGLSPVIQRITLFKESSGVYFDYFTNWKEENVMLKILYNTNTQASEVAADGMYCTNFSSTQPETPSDKARYEKICHKFFDLSTPGKEWGLALINEGKYAFDVKNDEMRLTMLRCCKYPDPSPEAWVNKEREINEKKYNHHPPKFSGLGPLKCRYLLFPHNGGTLLNKDDSINISVKRKSEEFNNPVLLFPLKNNQDQSWPQTFKSFLNIVPQNVILAALKKEEWKEDNNYIIRFVEICGKASEVGIKFNSMICDKILNIESIDLLERNIQESFKWNSEERSLKFNINGFEIRSFKLNLY